MKNQGSGIRDRGSGIRVCFLLFIFSFCSLFPVPRSLHAQETVCLDLKGIEAGELFKILSLKMNKTIVPTKSVAGRVNVYLNNLTFDDALEVILMSQGLARENKGDIINIMTSSEYEKLYGRKYNEKREFKAVKLVYAKPSTVSAALARIKSDIGKVITDEASGTIFLIDTPEKIKLMEEKARGLDMPLAMDIFYLNYAAPKDTKAYLSAMSTSGVGEVWVDERTNKVAICDLPDKVKKMRRLMRNFDVPPEQIFIEADIVELVLNDEYQHSIDWEKIFNRAGSENMLDFKGVFPEAPSFVPNPGLSDDYFKLTVGDMDTNKYSVVFDLLSALGEARLISHTYLSVANKQEATLEVASREPIVTQALNSSGTTTITADQVEFVDAGITLKLMPEIHDKEFITMKISAQSSFVKSVLKTDQSYVPIMGKSEADVTVKLRDRNTVLIAGLSERDIRDVTASLPSAPSIPGGILSGTDARRDKRVEYLFFIRPVRYGKM